MRTRMQFVIQRRFISTSSGTFLVTHVLIRILRLMTSTFMCQQLSFYYPMWSTRGMVILTVQMMLYGYRWLFTPIRFIIIIALTTTMHIRSLPFKVIVRRRVPYKRYNIIPIRFSLHINQLARVRWFGCGFPLSSECYPWTSGSGCQAEHSSVSTGTKSLSDGYFTASTVFLRRRW